MPVIEETMKGSTVKAAEKKKTKIIKQRIAALF